MAADPVELRRRMVDVVVADDYVKGCSSAFLPWQNALATVPRHQFIPDTVWVEHDEDGPPTLIALSRERAPDRWLQLVYDAGEAVVTQVDNGRPEWPDLGGSVPTSSASCPITVAVMLAALDAHEGHRVLEIGTGTGYNAALLAHRLGAAQVTSIEVDPDLASRARMALADTGFPGVTVVTGDGALGHPPGAEYDRVIATAGTVIGESSFMWLREQHERRGTVEAVVGEDDNRAEARVTRLHPYRVTGSHGARIAIGERVASCQWRYWPWEPDDPVGVLWLIDTRSRSWAKLTHASADAGEDEFPVLQFGPRRLWDEVEAAHQWWTDLGRPAAQDWRFTVTPHGQDVALGPLSAEVGAA